MASQVPPSTKPTPDAFKPLPPAADLYVPEDYLSTFAEHKTHTGASKVPPTKAGLMAVQGPVRQGEQGEPAVPRADAVQPRRVLRVL